MIEDLSDRQEESDRSNQGVASPDYAETLITHHANSNHHVLSLPKEEQVRINPPDDSEQAAAILSSEENIPLQ